MMSRTEEIRRLAYEIWLSEGSPHGRDEEHWREAERRFSSQRHGSLAISEPVKPAKRKSAKAMAADAAPAKVVAKKSKSAKAKA